MTDVHDIKTRSFNMSRIRSKDTALEIIVRRFLHARGFRYKLHDSMLPGKPDIVMPKYKTIIFVHGCFWHGHEGCSYAVIPKTRTEWWRNKIQKNKLVDRRNEEKLQELGWKVIVLYGCSLSSKKQSDTLNELITYIH